MSTRLYLEKVLKRYVPQLASLYIRGEKLTAHVYVADLKGETSAELITSVTTVLEQHHGAGAGYQVHPYRELEPDDFSEPTLSPEEEALASLGNCTQGGILENIRKLFPKIQSLQMLNVVPGEITILTSFDSETDSTKEKERLARVAPELFVPGIQIKMGDISQAGGQLRVSRRLDDGHLTPRSKADIVQKSDRDQKDKFWRLATATDFGEEVLPFKLDGTRLFLVPGTTNQNLLAVLPFYDQVFVQLPPMQGESDANEYLLSNFGLNLSDFLSLVRLQRVIPVFKFAYGYYADELTGPVLNDALVHIGPAELDLLALRSVKRWNSSVHVPRESAFEVLQWGKDLRSRAIGKNFLVAYELSRAAEFQVSVEDHYIPYFSLRGHLAAPHFAPVNATANIMGYIARFRMGDEKWKLEKEKFDWFSINLHSAVISIAIGDALGATICDGLTTSSHVLKVAASLIQGSGGHQFLKKDEAGLLDTYLSGLGISYSQSIPIKDYVNLFDAPEVRRMRKDLSSVLAGETDEQKSSHLRRVIAEYNREIDKFAKKDRYHLDSVATELMGKVKPSGEAGGWGVLAEFALRAISENSAAFKDDLASGRVADLIAIVRGTLNLTAPRVISLHHLRRRVNRLREDGDSE